MTDPETYPTKKRFSLTVLLLFLLILFTYANTFFAPFNFDDEVVILHEIAATGDRFYQLYPPVYRHFFYLSLAANYTWGEANPLGYHLFNITLHFGTTVLVLFTAFLTLNRGMAVGRKDAVSISCFTVFLFALMPVHSEAVTYISARATSMSAFFYLLSLLFFILGSLKENRFRWRPPVYYLFSLFAFFAAVLSKETALTLPAIVLLYDLIFMKGSQWSPLKNRVYYYYLPILAGVVFVFILSPTLLSVILEWLPRLDLKYAASQPLVIFYAIKLLFIPINLTFDYDFNLRFFSQGMTLVLGVTLFLALGLAFLQKMTKGTGLYIFSLLWFLILLSPTNSFLPRTDLLSERNLYLPSFGLLLLGATIATGVFKSIRDRFPVWRSYGMVFLTTLFILYSALLIQRNSTYRSNILLWEDTVKKSPGKLRALHNLSHFYLTEENYQKAFVILKKLVASRASPFYRSIAHNNLGNIYTQQENPAQAEKEFLEAIRADPTIPTSYFNLASLHAAQGHFHQAKRGYEQAEERYAQYRWGYLTPAELAFNKAKVHFILGLFKEAEQDLYRYLQQVPGSVEGQLLLGKIYAATERRNQAIDTLKSIQGNPVDEAQAHNDLGVLYIEGKKPDEAILEFKKAVSLNPNLPDAHYNLALLLAETQNDPTQARQYLQTAMHLNQDPARREAIQKRLMVLEK